MAAFAPLNAIELAALRCPGAIVIRATSGAWKELRRSIEQLCSNGPGELSLPISDIGENGDTPFPSVATLVFRCGTEGLRQAQSGSTLVIEGDGDDLLTLSENFDIANPVEGSHYHSDDWTPGVLPNAVPLVFLHVAQQSAL